MFEKIKLEPLNQFYPVKLDEIKNSESKLAIQIPELLKEFYLEVGYGFLKSKVANINRIMDPESILDFRLRQHDFDFYPDIEIYNQFEDDKLVFFEANEVALLSIGFAAENKGKIYYYDKEIAPNLVEFLERLMEDDTFYYDLI